MKPPFPYFGGKSRVAPLIWKAFGSPPNYVEPFAGSLATLLNRPNYDPALHTETVNDLDCFLSNFWRATQQAPEEVAKWADHPVNECDLHARHQWLVNRVEFRQQMRSNPDFYDAKIAGWWVWGLCSWIGSGWCADPSMSRAGGHARSVGVSQQLPHLSGAGQGIHRRNLSEKLPHLGDHGRGIHRKTPMDIYGYFNQLSERLRRVRVCCGDWQRVLGPSPTEKLGITGILLDPPYAQEMRDTKLYSTETDVSAQVREWAIANGNNSKFRIALCGYEGEHEMPADWVCIPWKAAGGYSSRNKDNQNAHKERIWFSPHCLKATNEAQQLQLFGGAA